ncbi:MAG: hypothetical protein GXO23_05435 [Crenarchaeota archaeon]|nr:hypothetical protein [Thermoproteota archaeon]
MSEEVVPVYAEGIHVMDLLGNVWLTLIFEYRDPRSYYYNLVKRGGQEIIEELETMMNNMQNFLDEEIIKINGERARPEVKDIVLGFRGSYNRPYVEFYIYFRGPLRPGPNRYDNFYDEETAEYDYEILWIFPEGVKVVDYHIAGDGRILGTSDNILVVHVRKGMRVGRHEWIEFEIPEQLLASIKS